MNIGKILLLLAVATAPALLTGCHDDHPRYHDHGYSGHHHGDHDRDRVVVETRQPVVYETAPVHRTRQVYTY